MTRTRKSARAAGARFQRTTADWLQANVSEFIEVAPKWGSRDRGDIVNLRTPSGARVAVEAKDYGGVFHVSEWLREAEAERVNDGALAGVVVAKRRGVADPAQQVCFMTLGDLAAIITGARLLSLVGKRAYADGTTSTDGRTP